MPGTANGARYGLPVKEAAGALADVADHGARAAGDAADRASRVLDGAARRRLLGGCRPWPPGPARCRDTVG